MDQKYKVCGILFGNISKHAYAMSCVA